MQKPRLLSISQTQTYNNVHESIYRAAQILRIVEEYLEKGVPNDVILEIITVMKYQEEENDLATN